MKTDSMKTVKNPPQIFFLTPFQQNVRQIKTV